MRSRRSVWGVLAHRAVRPFSRKTRRCGKRSVGFEVLEPRRLLAADLGENCEAAEAAGWGTCEYGELDRAEEGTWTAQLYDNSGNGPSSTTATGYYTKVGRVVHAMVAQFTNISTSGLSGILRMSLPFTPATGGFYSSGTAVMFSGTFPSSTYALRVSVYHGETRAYLQAVGTSGATSLSTSNITSGTTDISQITFSYIVA